MMLTSVSWGLRVVVVIVRQASGCGPFHVAAALSWYLHLREIILSYESRNNRDPTLRNLQGSKEEKGGLMMG